MAIAWIFSGFFLFFKRRDHQKFSLKKKDVFCFILGESLGHIIYRKSIVFWGSNISCSLVSNVFVLVCQVSVSLLLPCLIGTGKLFSSLLMLYRRLLPLVSSNWWADGWGALRVSNCISTSCQPHRGTSGRPQVIVVVAIIIAVDAVVVVGGGGENDG